MGAPLGLEVLAATPRNVSALNILGLIGFWVFGFEPRGRTFDEIDEQHEAGAAARVPVRAQVT